MPIKTLLILVTIVLTVLQMLWPQTKVQGSAVLRNYKQLKQDNWDSITCWLGFIFSKTQPRAKIIEFIRSFSPFSLFNSNYNFSSFTDCCEFCSDRELTYIFRFVTSPLRLPASLSSSETRSARFLFSFCNFSISGKDFWQLSFTTLYSLAIKTPSSRILISSANSDFYYCIFC